MKLNIVFLDWLKSRKISEKVLSDFGVHGESEIVIPVNNMDGDFLFNKYRRSPLQHEGEKYKYDRGAKVSLFAASMAMYDTSVLITEGELDCLVCWSHNIPAVTSTGGALSFQKEWASYFSNKEVILCFDNDPAGGEGMVKTLSVIPHAKIVFLPDRANLKDITDYVSSGGDLHTLIKTAKHFKDIGEVKEDMSERIAKFQSVFFHEAFIKAHTKVNTYVGERKSFDSDVVTNARLYPIPNLLDFVKNKACCPFHRENTASLHYYPKTNTCYCFGGCGRSYDVIDIYMNKYSVRFRKAVEELNKL